MRRIALVGVLVALLVSFGQGVASAAPERLTISTSSVHVDARIQKVGLTKAGSLAVGNALQGVVYTWRHGDPPCDPTGSTVYAGHAWRAGDGVADHWASLKRGDAIRLTSCRFTVTRVEFWPASRSIRPLFRRVGPAQIVLIGCKFNDYSERTMVFGRMS